MIIGCSAWDAHILAAYGEVARIWTVGSSTSTTKRKRQVEVGEITMGSRECSPTAEDVTTTPASTDDPHPQTLVFFRGLNILPIDPLLLDEDRERTKRR
jgi:hypothetical protein